MRRAMQCSYNTETHQDAAVNCLAEYMHTAPIGILVRRKLQVGGSYIVVAVDLTERRREETGIYPAWPQTHTTLVRSTQKAPPQFKG